MSTSKKLVGFSTLCKGERVSTVFSARPLHVLCHQSIVRRFQALQLHPQVFNFFLCLDSSFSGLLKF